MLDYVYKIKKGIIKLEEIPEWLKKSEEYQNNEKLKDMKK